MIILFVLLAIVSLIGVKFSRFHSDYMGVPQTTALKGFFAIIIVFSHMASYVQLSDHIADRLFSSVLWYIGQLMVTLFFFYSGFGIMESYRKKGKPYYRQFVPTRLLKVLLHFDLAVLLFFIVNLILGIEYPSGQYITCWFAWGSIGNSNWFIFDTIIFYLITFIAMIIKEQAKLSGKLFASVITVLCILFWGIMEWMKGIEASYWYNTILCFPLGFWYSEFKETIDRFAKKWIWWLLGLALFGVVFLFLYKKGMYSTNAYCLCAPLFCVLVSMVTMKVKITNKILLWLGKYSFAIYIIQRIPMIIFTHFGLNDNAYIFAALSIVATLPLAYVFTKGLDVLDRLLFKKKA